MKLAADSHNQIESFFRDYHGDENFALPEVHIYCGKFTRLFIGILKVHGITFGRRIFIWPHLIQTDSSRRRCISRKLVSHEIAHVLQYRKFGFAGFLFRYLNCYWSNLRVKDKWDEMSRQEAYLEIPFEVEARATADKFVDWAKSSQQEMLLRPDGS